MRIISVAPQPCPIKCHEPIVARNNPYLGSSPDQMIKELEFDAEFEADFTGPVYLFRTEVSL